MYSQTKGQFIYRSRLARDSVLSQDESESESEKANRRGYYISQSACAACEPAGPVSARRGFAGTPKSRGYRGRGFQQFSVQTGTTPTLRNVSVGVSR
jgi:hypothetical protein